MTRSLVRPFLFASLLTAVAGVCAPAVMAQDRAELAVYRNDRHGFSLSYPKAQFLALPAASDDGRIFVSQDGNARLLVGALPNFDGKSLRAYRDFVLSETYPGAVVDYAPVRDTWFVVSGTRNGNIFYQRVNFSCDGRVIKSWALLYPAAERAVYDRVVEQVARTFRAGDGNCG